MENTKCMGPSARHTISPETEEQVKRGRIPQSRVDRYTRLLERIRKEILPHPVIVDNAFTRWFSKGEFDREDLRHFLVQWSVFSNLFIEAQLKKVLNAPTLEATRISKEILMNELGVVFRSPRKDVVEGVDPELVSTEGTVEGGNFHFAAAHFEWLFKMCQHVGLTFTDIGKRRHGTRSTVFYCNELARLYGSDDPHIALGASFGVENWAAAGMWKEQIHGLEIFKKRECPELPLAFFHWHDRIEDQHAEHTWEELEDQYFATELNEEKFFHGAKEMLDGVKVFWDGLNEDRLKRKNERKGLAQKR